MAYVTWTYFKIVPLFKIILKEVASTLQLMAIWDTLLECKLALSWAQHHLMYIPFYTVQCCPNLRGSCQNGCSSCPPWPSSTVSKISPPWSSRRRYIIMSLLHQVYRIILLACILRRFWWEKRSTVTALQARTFAVWTLTSAVVRAYAAYNIHDKMCVYWRAQTW